jgi:hypothetical protein
LYAGERHAVGARLRSNGRVVRVQEKVELRLVEILRVDARGGLDAIGVIEQDAEVADAADAGLRAYGGQARLYARIAEDALLGLAGAPVVVDLLVRAPRHAHAPAAALVLVDEDDPVLLALVDRARRARRDARRVEAVLADPRQRDHERVLELAVDLLLDLGEVVVLRALRELAAEDLLPVGPPLDLLHPALGDDRDRPRDGCRLHFRRGVKELVVERERLVVVVDLRQVRVGEDLHQHAEPAPLGEADAAAGLLLPAAAPAGLVLPVLRIPDAGLRLDVVPPRVLHAAARRPHVLARDRARVAADALVEVHHHRDLRADFHAFLLAPRLAGAVRQADAAASGASIQSTFCILRTMTNSSRFEPTVP